RRRHTRSKRDWSSDVCSSDLSVGEGEGGMIWENGNETCIISYMKRVTSPGSMHNTGCLGLVHWDDPEGWYREGGGRRVQDGEHRSEERRVGKEGRGGGEQGSR